MFRIECKCGNDIFRVKLDAENREGILICAKCQGVMVYEHLLTPKRAKVKVDENVEKATKQ
jgi:hypothetical protein